MIDIFRLIDDVETLITSVSDKNTEYETVLMTDDHISISVVLPTYVDVKDGDYIYHNGLKYKQNRDVEYTKTSDVNYKFDFEFEHPLYTLLDKLFTYPLTGSPVFTLTGKLVDFVDAIIWNVNYDEVENVFGVDTGWNRGNIVDTDYLNISFNAVSCRDALTQIASSDYFNAEFYFDGENGKTINFVDHIENETGLVFIQGKGDGLYSITQKNVDTKDTITRVYPVGGNKNVPNANADVDGYLKLPEIFLQNTSEYNRIVEKRVVFDDIFPHFLGTIESVSGTDNVELICSQIDFDLNEIAVGDEARINFLTGSLMGISFQFAFDYALKKITLIPQNDDTALTNDDGSTPQVPTALKKASIGDKFNFTGVVMPEQYVNAAINLLREKATSWLAFYSRKRVSFELDIDYRWMRGKSDLKPGDLVTIQIPERSIDKLIRITAINKNLYNGKLKATVSNYLDENWEKKVDGAISSLQTTVSGGSYGSSVDILERYDARPASDRNVMSSLRSEKNFLRKDIEDTAAEYMHFKKGMDAIDFVQGKFAGSGAGIYKDDQGNAVFEVDKLTVRKEAYFNEIIINQIKFQGGIIIYSAANLEVSSFVNGGTYWEIHFDTKNGQILNQFVVGDQIRCQRFSGSSIIKYYMSLITSIGEDYIRISKSDVDGEINIEIGDSIIQYGNRTDVNRQALIEVNVLDGGKQTFYQGVNSYSMTDKNVIEIGRILDGGSYRNMIRAYGGIYLGNRDLSSYFAFNEETGLCEFKGTFTFSSGSSVEDALSQASLIASGAQTTANNAATAATAAQTSVNNLNLSPRNLFIAKDFIPAFTAAENGTKSIVSNYSFSMTATADNCYSKTYDILTCLRIPVTAGQTYYFAYKRANSTLGNAYIFFYDSATSVHYSSYNAKSGSSFYTTIPTGITHVMIRFGINTSGQNEIFSDIIFCQSSNAVGWSPSPEDVQYYIGGRNYVLGSGNYLTTTISQWIIDSLANWSYQLYNGYIRFTKLTTATGSWIRLPLSILLDSAKTYTLSIKLRRSTTNSGSLFLSNVNGNAQSIGACQTTANTWVVCKLSFIPSRTDFNQFMISSSAFTTIGETLDVEYIKIEEGSIATPWIAAIEDVPAAVKHIADAITDGSTVVNGGLTLGNLFFTKDLEGNVNGGMSGLDGDGVINWGGSSYAQALADIQKTFGSAMSSAFLNREDGGGHVAFGKIAWNNAGLLKVIGNIEALSGKIGNFKISDGAIVGYDTNGVARLKVSPINVPALSSIISTSWVDLNADSLDGYLTGEYLASPVVLTTSREFTIPIATKVNTYTEAGYQMQGGQAYSFSTTVKYYQGQTLIATQTGAYSTLPAGTYTVKVTSTLSFNLDSGEYPANVSLSHANSSVRYEDAIKQTEFGLNGMYSVFSPTEYFHFREGSGLSVRGATDIPGGLGGASINSSGGVVSGSPWGKMTIQGNGVSKNGSNYTITHYIGDTNYSLILTPISTNVPYFSSKSANTVVVTCAGGFDFVLIRTK